MKTIPIKYVILEGVDLSGKSSLYYSLNKYQDYSYNIQDRSFLSTLCYALLYDRTDVIESAREGLQEELLDLNNFFVILFPELDEILRRYRIRGDDIQDENSLIRLYNIFKQEVDRISDAPNVLVIRGTLSSNRLTSYVASSIHRYENLTPGELGVQMPKCINYLPSFEGQVRVHLQLKPDFSDENVMKTPHELEYYQTILTNLVSNIQQEMLGHNEYGKVQDFSSRRFYYNSNTCISSIHVMPRNGNVKVICTLRSTDVEKNGEVDLRFLSHLAGHVTREFKFPSKKIDLFVNFNSAHIRNDLK